MIRRSNWKPKGLGRRSGGAGLPSCSLFWRFACSALSGMNETFKENGFLLVSGLIERKVVDRAYVRLLSLTPADAAGSYHQFVRDREVVACFNDRVCRT